MRLESLYPGDSQKDRQRLLTYCWLEPTMLKDSTGREFVEYDEAGSHVTIVLKEGGGAWTVEGGIAWEVGDSFFSKDFEPTAEPFQSHEEAELWARAEATRLILSH